MAENSLKLRIQALVSGAKDVLGLNKSVDQLGKESEQTSKETDRLNKSLDDSQDAAKSSGAAMAKTAALVAGLGLAFSKVVSSVKEWVAAANIQERAETKLEHTLKNLVGASDEQIQALKDQAAALQTLTGYGDEQTISAQAMLGTFQLTADQIQQLTPRILDMAEAQRKAGAESIDLEQISIAVGKAFADGIGSLKRYGVALTEAQIEAFKVGDQSQKLAVVLEALDANFAGLAEAVGQTYEGAMRKAADAHGDLQEVLGQQITQNKDAANTVGAFTDAYNEMADGVKGSSDEISDAVSFMARVVKGALGSIQIAWNALQVGVKTTVLTINEGINLINKSMAAITFGDVSAEWQQAVDELSAANDDLRQSISEDLDDIARAGGKVAEAYNGASASAKTAAESFAALAKSGGLIEAAVEGAANGFNFFKQKANELNAVISSHIPKLFSLKEALSGIEQETNKVVEAQNKAIVSDAKNARSSFDLALAMVRLIEQKKKLNELYAAGDISQKQYSAEIKEITDATERLAQQQEKLAIAQEQSADSTQKSGERVKIFNEVVGDTSTVMEKMIAHLQFWRSEMDSLSETARNAFDQMIDSVNRAGGALVTSFDASAQAAQDNSAEIAALSQQIDHMRSAYDQATGDVNRWMIAVETAGLVVKRTFLAQEDAASKLEQRLKGLSSITDEQARSLIQAANSFNLLDQSRLDNIRNQVESLRAATEAMNDSALATLTSLQNELDRLNGNLAAIEARNFELKRLELLDKINQAQEAGDQLAVQRLRESLALLIQIHEIKQRNLQADNASSASTSAGGGSFNRNGSGTGQTQQSAPVTLEAKSETVINLDGKEVARVVTPYISEFGKLSG